MIYAPTEQTREQTREQDRLDRLMKRQQSHTAKSVSPGSLSNRLSTRHAAPTR